MSVSLFTQSIESATITLTNGGAASNSKLLQDRDERTIGLDVAAGTTTVTVHMDFGAAYTVDYVLFINLISSNDVDVDIDYSDNDSDWTEWDGDTDTYNGNVIFNGGASASHRYWRVEFDRSAGSQTLDLYGIFMGAQYDFPVDYRYNNNRGTFQRTEVMTDIYGYPYGQEINTSKKFIWDVVFNMTKAQVATLETELEYVGYNVKPFYITDSNLDASTTYRLVHHPNHALNTSNLAYDYYEVPLHLEEL